MANETKPDIRVPRGDQPELENSITREFTARRTLLLRGSFDTLSEARQCEANYNDLLDHWPDGVLRGLGGLMLIQGSGPPAPGPEAA